MSHVRLDEAPLALADLLRIAKGEAGLRLGENAWRRIDGGHRLLLRLLDSGEAIYGVTTGLGAAVDTPRERADLDFQRQIVPGRAAGVGRLANRLEVRAILATRLAGLAQGRSGISPPVVRALLAMLEQGIHPEVPLSGSVGESDLAPLAHLGLGLLGEGWVEFRGERLPAGEALQRCQRAPPPLVGKDGLALVSANAASVGLAGLLLAEADQALEGGLAALALTCEGLRANLSPFQPTAARLRPAPRQAQQARVLLRLLEGGELALPGQARRLQDPLSVRCGAIVQAAARDAWHGVARAVEIELAGAGDNPALVSEEAMLLANANFDSTHLALACESLGLALARLAACSAERVAKLVSPASSGLPRFLGRTPGQAGLVGLQRTAAALLAEIGHLANPIPAYCMPVAERVEDYAGQALACVEKTRGLVRRLRLLAAVELMVAAQAVDLRGDTRLGAGTARIHAALRARVNTLVEDRPTAPDIERIDQWLGEGELAVLMGVVGSD